MVIGNGLTLLNQRGSGVFNSRKLFWWSGMKKEIAESVYRS